MRLNAVGQAVRGLVGSFNFSKGVLAINIGGAATVKTTNALTYQINGIAYTKTALSAQALTTGGNPFYTQPANTTTYIVIALDAAGNVKAFQGTYAGQQLGTTPTSGAPNDSQVGVVGNGAVPDIDTSTYCPIGMIKVATGATTFLPGTDALDKASVTFTFYDLAMLPGSNP